MSPARVTRRLLAGYLSLAVFVLLLLEVPLAISYRNAERRDLETRLERDAVVLASRAEDAAAGEGRPALRAFAEDYTARTGARVVAVDARGDAFVDTEAPAPGVRNFASRPEFAEALAGRVASGTRHSQTLGVTLLYVTVPVARSGRLRGAVRVSFPTSELDERVRRYALILAATGVFVLALVAGIAVLLARAVARPLSALEHATAAAGRGDLSARAPVEGPPEVQSLARAYNETAARLEQLVRSQQEFVGDASHQLRTPLAALRLRLENLEHDVSPDARGELDGALREVERLGRVVEGLLALARADAATSTPKPVALAPLIAARVEAWTPLAAERGVALLTEVPESARARATPPRLEQVLDNLLENALAVTPAGRTIDVTVRPAQDGVELHVTDEGPGLAPADRERAFDRFWRGRDGRAGTGLGLAIVRRLVEADGGSVELREAPTGGVDAVVTLAR